MAAFDKMTTFVVVNAANGDTAEYDCMDLACAQMLAAEDHGGAPEDWMESGTEVIRHSEDGEVNMVWCDGLPVRRPTQDDMNELPAGPDMTAE